ncbi:MAG TPA: YceD family protein [Jatrophihabitantaceae bacterium]
MPENSTPTSHRSRPPRSRRDTGHSGADPKSPFVHDVRPLGRRPGAMREDRRSVPAPTAIGTDLIGVAEGALLEVDVRLESVTEGVLVTGTVTASLRGECARCLDPISDELVVDVVELFAWPDSVTDETTSADEVHRIVGDYLDIEPVVRDGVVLGLPWTPLCRPDCAGLCPICGQRLDDLPAGHAHETIDPRWAGLAKFADDAAEPDS